MNKERLSLIQGVLDEMVETKWAAGASVLVFRHGKEQCYYQAGYRDIEAGKKIERDSIFRMYSMTKPLTSTLVMKLLEDGKLDLLDPVHMYLPGFKNQKYIDGDKLVDVELPVNIKQLLDMTSGVSYPGECNASDKAVAKVVDEAAAKMYTADEMSTYDLMNKVGECPLAFKPGATWQYGFSADVLGAIIEVITGKNLADYMKETLFDPLDMVDSGFYVPEGKQDRLSRAYEACDNGLIEYSGENLLIQSRMKQMPKFISGGAGLASTIDDYSHFNMMLMNKGEYNGRHILHPQTVKFMTAGSLTSTQEPGTRAWESLAGFTYGNLLRVMKNPGEAISVSTKGEYGWDGWLGAYMVNIPEYDIMMLMMQQKKDTGTTEYTRRIRNIMYSSV